MTLIGELCLWVALLMAAWSTTVSFAGGAMRRADFIESGLRGLYATFAMLALAAAGLWTALLSRDFSLEYVSAHISQNTPGVYAFTAFWSGAAGSLLFWALILAGYGTIAVATRRHRDPTQVSWTAGTLSAILLVLVATTCFGANPFVRLDITPLDGRGMEPRLQNPAAALSQLSLYLGYVATTLPFAVAIAALLTAKLDAESLGAVRRWSLISWFALTIGVVAGIRWAYVAPWQGPAGEWWWYAVRSSSILPWIALTASLHSMSVQGRRAALRKWNVVFAAASFLLSLYASFIAHDGLIESDLSPAQSPIARLSSAFFFLAAGLAVYLIGTRLRNLDVTQGLNDRASNRRRYGGYAAHAGAVMVLVALAGLPFTRQYDTRLRTGESYQATDPYGRRWRFVSQGVSQFEEADHVVAILALDTYRDGKRVGLITSERRTYRDVHGDPVVQPTIHVGIRSTAILDTYVVPGDLRRQNGFDVADVHIAFNPLVVWVWAGGLLMAAGGLVVVWPRAEREREQPVYVAA